MGVGLTFVLSSQRMNSIVKEYDDKYFRNHSLEQLRGFQNPQALQNLHVHPSQVPGYQDHRAPAMPTSVQQSYEQTDISDKRVE